MKQRLIGALLIGIVVIPCFLIGGIVFDIFALLVGIFALIELINADKELKNLPLLIKGISLISVPLIAYGNLNNKLIFGIELYTISIPIILILLFSLLLHNKGLTSSNAFKLSFISIFVGYMTCLFINVFDVNKWIFLWLILIGMATDVFAYCGGKLIGKHKFSKISPNKTIEGCISGIIFGSLAGYFYYVKVIENITSAKLILFVILLSIVGELGDLFFSLIKRENNIKDYSHLIPGHGGICDRIDSLTFIILLYSILSKLI